MKIFRVLFSSLGAMALVSCGAPMAATSVSSPGRPQLLPARRQRLLRPDRWLMRAPQHSPCSSHRRQEIGFLVPPRRRPQTAPKMFGDCPFSAAVRARLADLASRNYFYSGPGGHCGGDYIIGSVNGLSAVPEVLSAVGNSNGTVTVVIQRVPSVPNLTPS